MRTYPPEFVFFFYSAISGFSPEMEFKEHDTLVEAGLFAVVLV
jgi:hypothetical protein